MAKVVFKSENYKERNQCVFTLTSLKQRSLYGSYFFLTWQGLLQALNFPDDLRPTEVTQVEKLQLEVGNDFTLATLMLCVKVVILKAFFSGMPWNLSFDESARSARRQGLGSSVGEQCENITGHFCY